MKKIEDKIVDRVYYKVRRQINDQLRAQVGDKVFYNKVFQICEQVRHQVWNQTWLRIVNSNIIENEKGRD